MRKPFAAAAAIVALAVAPAFAQTAAPGASAPVPGSPADTTSGVAPTTVNPLPNPSTPAADANADAGLKGAIGPEATTGAPAGGPDASATGSVSTGGAVNPSVAPAPATPGKYPICRTRAQDSCRVSGRAR